MIRFWRKNVYLLELMRCIITLPLAWRSMLVGMIICTARASLFRLGLSDRCAVKPLTRLRFTSFKPSHIEDNGLINE